MAGNDAVRRTWDTAAYARRAAASNIARSGVQKHGRRTNSGPRSLLQARQAIQDLDARVGTITVVEGGRDRRGGYWCESCESLLKDSNAWLNHINGRRHQRVLGMGMRVERTGAEEIRAKLKRLKEENSRQCGVGKVQGRVRTFGKIKGPGKSPGNELGGMGAEEKRKLNSVELDKNDIRDKGGSGTEKESGDSEEDEEDDEISSHVKTIMELPTGFASSKGR